MVCSIAAQKLSPFMGKVAASVTSRLRGCNEASVVYVNPSVNPPHGVLPAPRKGEPFGTVQTRRTVPYPFAERSFQWGYGGVQGGLRGEIEIFPGPPCKKVIKKLIFYLFVSLPQKIRLQRISSSLQEGAFWVALYAKIYELTLRLEQGRLTHCRS